MGQQVKDPSWLQLWFVSSCSAGSAPGPRDLTCAADMAKKKKKISFNLGVLLFHLHFKIRLRFA